MKTIRILTAALAVMTAVAASADSREVVQIKYTDGVVDYIPVDNISKINFTKGIESSNATVSKVNAIFDGLKSYGEEFSTNHNNFGYPALIIGMDAQTADVVRADTGYNWFFAWGQWNVGGKYVPSVFMWVYMYQTIDRANDVINSVGDTSESDRLLKSQAYAMRSWAYWNLVQCYAPRYAVSASLPSVPILNEQLNNSTVLSLATVKEVYDCIFEDINRAISYLDGNRYEPAHIDVTHAKKYIDLGTAYGLRARYNLTIGEYRLAEQDAQKAIETTSARCLLPEAAAYPGFNDEKLGNWMWAVSVDLDDRVVTSGIVNFASHVSAFMTNGYTGVGSYHACSTLIWNYIDPQPGDVRRNWWVDGIGYGSMLTKPQLVAVKNVLGDYHGIHQNVKFDTYGGKVIGSNGGASDIPLMRVEEMYLIRIESLARMGSTTEALNELNDWVATYRNPSYNYVPSNPDELLDEIDMQRRVELWGEGFGYFDMKRLGRDLDRYGDTAYSDKFVLRIRANSDFMQMKYPDFSPRISGYNYEAASDSLPVIGIDGTWNE